MGFELNTTVPPGYLLGPDGTTLKKVITNNKELRRIMGKCPFTGAIKPRYQAFYISLPIRKSASSKSDARHGVFTHGKNETHAAILAGQFWNDQVRVKAGKAGENDFPKLVNTEWDLVNDTAPIALPIDNDDFDALHRDALKFKDFCHAGDQGAPITFMLKGETDIFSFTQWKTRNQK